jgi:ArsR family transcriptional regulator, arsenate/arsenite/antimonite-responsive transcriptional repressor
MELTTAVTALAALGEPTRLSIFRLLVEAGPTGLVVGQIAERLTVAPATLSFHLKTLAQADLVRATKERQFLRYVANFESMNALLGFLTDNCCGGNPQLCAPVACEADASPRKASHAA